MFVGCTLDVICIARHTRTTNGHPYKLKAMGLWLTAEFTNSTKTIRLIG